MPNWTPDTIRALRERMGLTQRQMATRLGYKDYRNVLYLESGVRNPGPAVRIILDQLAREAESRSDLTP